MTGKPGGAGGDISAAESMKSLGMVKQMIVGDDIALDPREVLRLHVLYLENRRDLSSSEREVFGRYLKQLADPVFVLAPNTNGGEPK